MCSHLFKYTQSFRVNLSSPGVSFTMRLFHRKMPTVAIYLNQHGYNMVTTAQMFRVNQRSFVLKAAFVELLPKTHTKPQALFYLCPPTEVGIYASPYSDHFRRKV